MAEEAAQRRSSLWSRVPIRTKLVSKQNWFAYFATLVQRSTALVTIACRWRWLWVFDTRKLRKRSLDVEQGSKTFQQRQLLAERFWLTNT